jgi:hypothetical protein
VVLQKQDKACKKLLGYKPKKELQHSFFTIFKILLIKKKVFLFFPLEHVIGVYLVTILMLLIRQGSKPLLLIGWWNQHILPPYLIIGQWPILRCLLLVFSKTPAASHFNFFHEVNTVHSIFDLLWLPQKADKLNLSFSARS